MFRRTYKVKGEDVDDFMVMQDSAYHSYSLSTLDTFLYDKGYSKHKLNNLKIGFKKCSEELIYLKHLMFTQHFSLNLEFLGCTESKQKIKIRSRFFNTKNELCAMSTTQINWFNPNNQEIISLPKKIMVHLSM